jgi:hypothetical protein
MPTVAKGLSPARLRDLARAGAAQALKELRADIVAIERTFPELKLPQARRALRRSVNEATRRTRRMSAAARKAVSTRMKRYWAERRKARAKVKWTEQRLPVERHISASLPTRVSAQARRSLQRRKKRGGP